MNKYEIVKTLGQGGYGKANLVRRKTDKKLFVEKEVRLTSLGPKDREGAIQEAKLLASLKHPYIVEYEESFQERGNLYIIMGYADGGDLAKKIESRGNRLFTEDEILHDFIEVALAIKYIHDRKICHRDLKGQNIFLTKDGTIKLGDFGISKILEHTFQACRTQIGTPFYLSPEICQGRNYNTKTDIWSLGCILYELCTLKHAFNAPNMKQLMMNIIQARYTPVPSQYSQDLRSLVDRMLTKEPEKRPTINQILNTPYIKKQLSNFLEKTLLEYEMGHTRLHDRKPFAPPTIIVSKDPQPSKPSQPPRDRGGTYDKYNDDYKEQKRNYEMQQKQLQMKEAALKKREAELAARERALNNNRDNNYNRGGNPSGEDDARARQFYEGKRAMLENKARMQQEMSGNNMRYALQNQFPKGKRNDDYSYSYSYSDDEDTGYKSNKKGYNKPQNQSNYEQQARENYFEQLRMVRANRERMKREELQGSEMQRALMDAQVDNDDKNRKNNRNDNNNYQDKRKGGNDNFEAINAYMRQQRHEAAENKRRLEEAERGSAAKAALAQPDERTGRTKHQTIKRKNFNEKTGKYDYDYYSDYYSDYSDTPPRPQQQQQKPKSPPPPQQQPPSKQKPKDDIEARNEYMRQLRHEREANRIRALEAEKKAKEEEDRKKRGAAQPSPAPSAPNPSKQPNAQNNDYESDNEPPPQKEKKVELSQAERNAYMREERHRRRENKARIEAMGRINMDQLIAEAEAEQRANPRLDDSVNVDNNNNKEPEIEDNEPPPQKEKKVELTQAERNAYMREERHRRRENKARIEAMGRINMDQLIAEAEAEQRANPKLDEPKSNNEQNRNNNHPSSPPEVEDNEPPPQKEKKVELTQAERNAYMREERHKRRENKARIEAMGKIDMDQLIAQAEAEQRANPQSVVSQENSTKQQKTEKTEKPTNNQKEDVKKPESASKQPKKSPRLLGDDVKEAIKSGRFKTTADQKSTTGNSAKNDNSTKMTVAEARKQQKQSKDSGNADRGGSPSNKSANSQAPILDKNKMKELFQMKREGIRQNHEKIKAAQEGSRDPSLLAPASNSSSSSSSKSSSRSPLGRLLTSNVSGKASNNTNGSSGSVRKQSLKPEMANATFAEKVPDSKSENTSKDKSNSLRKKKKSSSKEKTFNDNGGTSPKLDLSQALNSKSTGEFLKSRSLVLDNIANEDENQIENMNESLDVLKEKADIINAALDIKDEDLVDKDDDNDNGNENNANNDMNNGVDYYLKNRGVNLPAISDKDSISYRAEAIRAFLEKKIGIEKVIALKKAALNENGHGDEEGDNIFKDLEQGVVALARYLFMLDETFE
ncbi:hypothetical protein M9Y10_023525 [Tritrichomonas musculus]|uniref:non-specific serine/threonine protein kinase n=1 Tax=Tritrichomonas musculus TaxID=1915356 RepID=A0ABR2KW52_9EUKA